MCLKEAQHILAESASSKATRRKEIFPQLGHTTYPALLLLLVPRLHRTAYTLVLVL